MVKPKKAHQKNPKATGHDEKANEAKHGKRDDNHDGNAAAASTPGCICPNGCIVGKPITISEVVGLTDEAARKYVKVVCTNESKNCPIIPFVHAECFQKWEDQVRNILLHNRNEARNWAPYHREKALWNEKGFVMYYNWTRCACGGFLSPAEVPKSQQPQPQPQPKPHKKSQEHPKPTAEKPKLPTLVTTANKLGGQSLFKTCSGQTASTVAAKYAARDYANRRPIAQKPARPPGPSRSAYRPSVEEEESDDEWTTVMRPFRRTSTASLTSTETESYTFRWGASPPESRPPSRLSSSFPPLPTHSSPAQHYSQGGDFEIIDENVLIKEIQDLLTSFGGQLPLNDELLTGIMGRACTDLAVAICDAGGLEIWLGGKPEFIVGDDRLTLRRYAKREPSILRNSGIVESVRGQEGVINCTSCACMVYFDASTNLNNEELRVKDVVKFEAVECRPSGANYRWKAVSVTVLQRELAMAGVQPKSASVSPTDELLQIDPLIPKSRGNQYQSTGPNYSGMVTAVKSFNDASSPLLTAQVKSDGGDFDDAGTSLTVEEKIFDTKAVSSIAEDLYQKYLPNLEYSTDRSIYSKTLKRIKSLVPN